MKEIAERFESDARVGRVFSPARFVLAGFLLPFFRIKNF